MTPPRCAPTSIACPSAPRPSDHVLTNAALEHVADPFLAVREVARVLRAGGIFSGSTAFLEPHHHASRFHLTADGLTDVLTRAGLSFRGMWAQEGWTVLDSLAWMPGPISAPTRWTLRTLARLERTLRRRHLHPRARGTGRWLRRRTPAELHAYLLPIAGQIDSLAVHP